MSKFDNLNNEIEEKEVVTVEIASLSGVEKVEVEEGTTVEDLRNKLGLASGTKILDEDGDVLTNSSVIDEDCTLYTSVPKKNGKVA